MLSGQELPVDAILPGILKALQRSPNLVIEAPPGAGKTTRVPPALLSIAKQVVVLEPRRIAARMAARRVAAERGERVGETVGYQVRFEEAAGPATRLRFLTEGVLTRKLLADPNLTGIDLVCLDEFHERHLDGDLALALLRRIQQSSRPDLKLVVMSATLDTEAVARFLGDCPVLRSEGRLFGLTVKHLPYSPAPLEEQVAGALETILAGPSSGDVLVFLPGAAEIRRTGRALEGIARSLRLLVLPLHGDLPAAEQDRAVERADRRKVILSTNLAESSITVEGVDAVIDSGLARSAEDSPWTGLPTLRISRISKASAAQRAGRAGRTGPGYVVRLFTEEDLARRPAHDAPEVARRELTQLVLDLCATGISASDIEWLTPPNPGRLESAAALLRDLHALDSGGKLTPTGRRMSRYPLHPRLARVLVRALELGAAEEGCRAVALLSSGVRARSMNLLDELDAAPEPPAAQAAEHLRRMVRPSRKNTAAPNALERALLAGFPDRVARKRGEKQILLATGQSAELIAEGNGEFWIALDIEDRPERALPVVRLVSPIEPDWLADELEERVTLEWDRTAERVDAVSALLYRQLVVDETRGARPDARRASELLAAKAVEAGVARFVEREVVDRLIARSAFAAAHGAVRRLTEADAEECLRALCAGCRSFAELKGAAAALPALLRAKTENAALLEALAPERIDLPRRKNIPVHYSLERPPWIESRLQDFFGLTETPRVARGAAPLVVHLLAPNRRPVQTTTDLAGFWKRLYPQVRKELSRRYPRHAWPEAPGTP
jgi:ATP-dependent helicase HrpB